MLTDGRTDGLTDGPTFRNLLSTFYVKKISNSTLKVPNSSLRNKGTSAKKKKKKKKKKKNNPIYAHSCARTDGWMNGRKLARPKSPCCLLLGVLLDSQGCKVSSYIFWSGCADEQTDLRLRREHMSKSAFSPVSTHIVTFITILTTA